MEGGVRVTKLKPFGGVGSNAYPPGSRGWGFM